MKSVHELAIAQALVEQAEDVVRSHQAQRATSLTLSIGPLSGVVPELLANAFPLVAAGTLVADATLEFSTTPIVVRCQSCQAETTARINHLVCGACGDWHTRIISGDDLLLQSIELEN